MFGLDLELKICDGTFLTFRLSIRSISGAQLGLMWQFVSLFVGFIRLQKIFRIVLVLNIQRK